MDLLRIGRITFTGHVTFNEKLFCVILNLKMKMKTNIIVKILSGQVAVSIAISNIFFKCYLDYYNFSLKLVWRYYSQLP